MTISKVLITGGTGFFGYWLKQTQPRDINAVYLNHKDYDNGMWMNVNWDAVIHAANVTPLPVLESHKGRVMYVSSGGVYERQDEYSDNKRKWEALCDDTCVIVRPFCFVGEKIPDRYSIKYFINAGLRGETIHYYDVGCIRSYLYGGDLGRWLWKILLEGQGIYDVGSNIPVNMRYVVETVADYFGVDTVPDLVQEYEAEYKVYLPDCTRAHALGCKETVALREAIERTAREG